MSGDLISQNALVNLGKVSRRRLSRRLQAAVIAPEARARLATAGSGRVMHVLSRACNMLNAEGQVISLVLPPLPMGPFSIRLSDRGWTPQDFNVFVKRCDTVQVHGQLLAIGNLEIEIGEAVEWAPQPDWAHVRTSLLHRMDRLEEEIVGLLQDAPQDSLASGAIDDSLIGDSFASRFQRSARPSVVQLRRGLSLGVLADVEAGAAGLAGVGLGLTPAGDDFLLGVLISLRAVWPHADAEKFAGLIVKAATPHTTRLSSAWLRAAGRGEVDETWHRLFVALLDGRDDLVAGAGKHILARGHTSGADALAGFAIALAACRAGRSAVQSAAAGSN